MSDGVNMNRRVSVKVSAGPKSDPESEPKLEPEPNPNIFFSPIVKIELANKSTNDQY